jgi:phosphoglycolate phosphatase-like HAD superfamily hydrolase
MDVSHPKRVLIFENEYLIALDLEETLSTIDVDSRQALTANEAIRLLEVDAQIDFALINFHAEGVGRVVETLRSRNIRFAVCSGCSVDEIEEAFGTAVPHLSKPFVSAELVALVRQLFGIDPRGGRAATA